MTISHGSVVSNKGLFARTASLHTTPTTTGCGAVYGGCVRYFAHAVVPFGATTVGVTTDVTQPTKGVR